MRRPCIAATVLMAAAAGMVPVAQAATRTVDFFQDTGSPEFYTAQGNVIPQGQPGDKPLIKGNYFVQDDTDYAGTAVRHAKRVTATDHLFCTYLTPDLNRARCYFELDEGHSKLLLNHYISHLTGLISTMKISGGTGSFRGARGTLTVITLADGNRDLVLKIS
jgi:hypothetical protein